MRLPQTDELEKQRIIFYKLINGYLTIGWFGAVVYGLYSLGKWMFA